MIDITQQNPRSPILSQWIFPVNPNVSRRSPGRDVGLHGVGRGRSPFWIGANWSRGRECGMGKLGLGMMEVFMGIYIFPVNTLKKKYPTPKFHMVHLQNDGFPSSESPNFQGLIFRWTMFNFRGVRDGKIHPTLFWLWPWGFAAGGFF